MGMRQEEDGPPRVKQVGDSFSIDQNSKTRIAGQLKEEAGACTDHIFLVPEVSRPPQPHMHIKAPWRSKGELCQGMSVCLVKSILAKGCMQTHGGILRYIKCGL